MEEQKYQGYLIIAAIAVIVLAGFLWRGPSDCVKYRGDPLMCENPHP